MKNFKKRIKTKVSKWKIKILYLVFASHVLTSYHQLNKMNSQLITQQEQIILLNQKIKQDSKPSNRWIIILKKNKVLVVYIAGYLVKHLWKYYQDVLQENKSKIETVNNKLNIIRRSQIYVPDTNFETFLKICMDQLHFAISSENSDLIQQEEDFQLSLRQIIELGTRLRWNSASFTRYQDIYNSRQEILNEHKRFQSDQIIDQLENNFSKAEFNQQQLINTLNKEELISENARSQIAELQKTITKEYGKMMQIEKDCSQLSQKISQAEAELNSSNASVEELDTKIQKTFHQNKQLEKNMTHFQKKNDQDKINENNQQLKKTQKELIKLKKRKEKAQKSVKNQDKKIQNYQQKFKIKEKNLQEQKSLVDLLNEKLQTSEHNLNDSILRTASLRNEEQQGEQLLDAKRKVILEAYERRKQFQSETEKDKLSEMSWSYYFNFMK